MKYLIEIKHDHTTYEAWVEVREDEDGVVDVDFATCLGWINDEVVALSDIPFHRKEEMLSDAVDEYRMDYGADAAYDAMRDAQ